MLQMEAQPVYLLRRLQEELNKCWEEITSCIYGSMAEDRKLQRLGRHYDMQLVINRHKMRYVISKIVS